MKGENTDAKNLKITAITIGLKTEEDYRFVKNRLRDLPTSRRGGKRKEIVFLKDTPELYAKQLDFFNIELAILTPDGKIKYASHFSKDKPDVRVSDDPANEKRYYIAHRSDVSNEEIMLLNKAGIEIGDNNFILLFLPSEVETILKDLESSYPKANLDKPLKKTRYGIRKTEKGFSIYVIEQIEGYD